MRVPIHRVPSGPLARAVTAGEEMQVALRTLNRKWDREGLERFEVGIGIHLGEAVVGEIRRMIRAPEVAVRAIDAFRMESPTVDEQAIISALGEFDQLVLA